MIPTCKHFFHPKCCIGWFQSKVEADEQLCPQCNTVLHTITMIEAKEEMQKADFVAPKVKSHDKSKVNPHSRNDSRVGLTELGRVSTVSSSNNIHQPPSAPRNQSSKKKMLVKNQPESSYDSGSAGEWEVGPSVASSLAPAAAARHRDANQGKNKKWSPHEGSSDGLEDM